MSPAPPARSGCPPCCSWGFFALPCSAMTSGPQVVSTPSPAPCPHAAFLAQKPGSVLTWAREWSCWADPDLGAVGQGVCVPIRHPAPSASQLPGRPVLIPHVLAHTWNPCWAFFLMGCPGSRPCQSKGWGRVKCITPLHLPDRPRSCPCPQDLPCSSAKACELPVMC